MKGEYRGSGAVYGTQLGKQKDTQQTMNAVARAAMKAPAMTRSFAAAANQKYYILMCTPHALWITHRRLCGGNPREESSFPRRPPGSCQGTDGDGSLGIGTPRQGNDVHDRCLCEPSRWCYLHFQG